MTFVTTGLLRDSVYHAGGLEGIGPWPCPVPAGRGPDGVDDRPSVEEAGQEKLVSSLMTGVICLARLCKANHMLSMLPKSLCTAAKSPGNSVRVKVGCCLLTRRLNYLQHHFNPCG